MVVNRGIAGDLVVGARLIKGVDFHPDLKTVEETRPRGLTQAAAEALAKKWEAVIKKK